MKKSEKRLISIVLVIAIIASVLSICATVFAKSQRLILDVLYSDSMDGSEDLNWYIYTPEVSGTYSFLSFNVAHSEAYLFVKESDPMGTNRIYTQLAYSSESPDFAARGQSGVIQFCLTYHLEAGVTYYYTAGWWSSGRTNGTMNVKLVCDEYDDNSIESISLSSGVTYTENTNGSWMTDSTGAQYFSYNLSRLLTNLTVTVHYKDGTSSSVTGKDSIDGNAITYSASQDVTHWYPQTSSLYTANKITVTVLGTSADYDVIINESGLKSVTLKVIDYTTGEPVPGAVVTRENDSQTTGDNGIAIISMKSGNNEITVTDMFALKRTATVVINTSISSIDITQYPIGIVTGDYNSDSVINGKDYAYILKNFTGDVKSREISKFKKQIDFKESSYPALVIQS